MKIMFICTGNICRSAMAHWMLKHKIEEKNIKHVEVYSSGTTAFTGDTPTEEAKEVMKEYGINMNEHEATNIVESNIKEMDLILCATRTHKMQVLKKYPKLKEKTYTMKEYVKYDKEGHNTIDINDPWGYSIVTYRYCASEIEECLEILIKELEKSKNM